MSLVDPLHPRRLPPQTLHKAMLLLRNKELKKDPLTLRLTKPPPVIVTTAPLNPRCRNALPVVEVPLEDAAEELNRLPESLLLVGAEEMLPLQNQLQGGDVAKSERADSLIAKSHLAIKRHLINLHLLYQF